MHSFHNKLVLLPISWDTNSTPLIGDRPQEILNKQILKHADLLIGIFWTRIGTPTGKAVSGTVEEIEKHIKLGKPTMLYFSNTPVRLDKTDSKQYESLQAFKVEYQSKGMISTFDSLDHFKNSFSRGLSIQLNTNEYFERDTSDSVSDTHNWISPPVQLSAEAKTLLVKVGDSENGKLGKNEFGGGFIIEIDGRLLYDYNETPRTMAKWKSAFRQLEEKNFIEPLVYGGEIFQLTQKGYEMVDKLKSDGD